MKPVTRFAPSPTGNLHIGNARTALINHIFAKSQDGTFILRFDDTDGARSREEFVRNIAADLAWLGIEPDLIIRQSERLDSYRVASDRLIAAGLLYACYETQEELERKRRRLIARGQPPIYDRAALTLGMEERKRFEAEGRKPHWRFLLPNFAQDWLERRKTEVSWDDLIRGRQTIDLASLSDPVLMRADGTWLYTLPSVVDDINLGVTHVIRGDDHTTNTAVQIALFEALGAEPPQFGHHNLLTDAKGEGLSKRLGSLSLQGLAAQCYEPMAVASLAVLIGGSGAVEPMPDMEALMRRFDIAAVSKSPARFDMAELDSLNRRLVHEMDWEQASRRFSPDAFEGRGEEFWLAIRSNLEKACEAEEWWRRLMQARPQIASEDREFIALAREYLPDEPWSHETWGRWTSVLKEKSGRKGRELFLPLRKAITGMESGPEMAALLPIIGRERTLARLS